MINDIIWLIMILHNGYEYDLINIRLYKSYLLHRFEYCIMLIWYRGIYLTELMLSVIFLSYKK